MLQVAREPVSEQRQREEAGEREGRQQAWWPRAGGGRRGLLHAPAAEHAPLRREDADHADEPEREIAGLELPDAAVAVELDRRPPPPLLERAAGGETFEAVAVVRAHPRKRVRV